MGLELRRGTPADASECGQVCFEAFKAIADRHAFPRDFPSPEAASSVLSFLLSHPKFHSTVAEHEGRIVGSNFLDERCSTIAGVGPISVDPSAQGKGVGRRLMTEALERARARNFGGIRLVQVSYNNQTLCLYSRLGFRTREPLSLVNGPPPKAALAGYAVRPAQPPDIEPCNHICRAVHGHDRSGELEEAVAAGTAKVVEYQGRITGYATAIGFFTHAVSENDAGLMALIGAADQIAGPGLLVPTRNHTLFTWCLDHGFKLVQQMTLMTIGLYNEPSGAYLPSVLY